MVEQKTVGNQYDDDKPMSGFKMHSSPKSMIHQSKFAASQKRSPRDPNNEQLQALKDNYQGSPQPQDTQSQKSEEAQKPKNMVYEPKLADYFAIVGLDDETHPIDGGAEQLKLIERCEVVILEKQSVSEAKKQLYLTRNAKVKQWAGDGHPVPLSDEQEAFAKIQSLSEEEKTPYEMPNYDPDHEKWIDLDGTGHFYLRLIYGKINPITEFNFFYISSKMEHKIQIPESMEIQPVQIKRVDDIQADKKFFTVVKKSRSNEGKGGHTIFHGTYDLKYYLDRQEPIIPKAGTAPSSTSNSDKILCLCVKRRTRQGDMPVYDVNVIEGEAQSNKSKKIQYNLPQDPCLVTYRLGLCKQRLMFFQKLDLLKTRFKASVLDRYPLEDRPGYEFSSKIGDFCFPHGIMLSFDHMVPQCFSFILTDSDGSHIYGTCLSFSEKPSSAIRLKLKQAQKEVDKIWTQKAICILSHFSFMDSFKQALKKIYQIHLSQNMKIPLERFIVNIMDEVPLPDQGNIMIQHDMEETILFYRPIDQYPPYASKQAIQNIFKALSVDDVIELFMQLLLERKILLISQHKALLTHVAVALQSFIFPLQWNQTIIPILPTQMIDVLDAPFPFLFGIQSQILQNALSLQHIMISNEITQVDLDQSKIFTSEYATRVCKMPRDFKQFREKLLKATAGVTERPDPDLEHVDDAFFRFMQDPDEIDNYIDEIEVRDAFLEFMQRVMSNYQKYLKDPGLNKDGKVPDHANARDFFNFDKFRADKDATKSISFINKLTQTNNFCKFIEARSLGKTDNDKQIMHFDQQLKEKRTNQKRFLVTPIKEKKVVKSMQVNEEQLDKDKNYLYQTFPSKFDQKLFIQPRKIYSYAGEDTMRSVHLLMVSNDQIQKMHETDWAKYMAEVIYCLWFQVFAATLPMYQTHSSEMISFARKLLQYINNKLKPLKEVEIVYRRMFEACGLCMQLEQIKELYKELQSMHNFAADKVTYGTYYQALVLCQRQRSSSQGKGTRESAVKAGESERKARYLNQDDLDHITALQRHEEEKERINNPNGINQQTYPARKSNVFRRGESKTDDEFDELFEKPDQDSQYKRTSNGIFQSQPFQKQVRLSQVLENSLYIEINKECPHCTNPIKEEELFSGLQKNQSDYTAKCPLCLVPFVPKFTLYSEYQTDFINGRDGLTLQLLPPVPLYKEFLNTLGKKGDRILTQEAFLHEHSVVFWNMIVYFKIMKLPCFIIDQDYSQKHVKVQVSWINKYLPDKAVGSSSSKQATRSSFGSKTRLDKDGLSKLDRQQAQSPIRNNSLSRMASGIYNKIKASASKGPNSTTSGGGTQITNQNNTIVDQSLQDQVNNSYVNNIPINSSNNITTLAKVGNLVSKPSIGLVNLAKSATHSVKSGSGSVITSTSDLERFERLMVYAKHANKNIIRQFGKQLEEFRREMQYSKEIILSDLLTQGIPDSMIRHAGNVNIAQSNDPFKQSILAKVARQGSNIDNFMVEEPTDVLNMARTSQGISSAYSSDDQPSKSQPVKLKQVGPIKSNPQLQQIAEMNESQVDHGCNSPSRRNLPPKHEIQQQQRTARMKSPGPTMHVKQKHQSDDEEMLDADIDTENARQSHSQSLVNKQSPSISTLHKLISINSMGLPGKQNTFVTRKKRTTAGINTNADDDFDGGI